MIWLSTALAAVPPDVVLEDIVAWETAADDYLDGPPGCWEVEARATRKVIVFAPPDVWSSGTQYEEVITGQITGQLRDGTWTHYAVEGLDRGDPSTVNPLLRLLPTIADQLDVIPLVGRLPSAGEHAPTNLVRQVVDEWGGDMSTSLAEWDSHREGVWVRREVPIRRRSGAPISRVDTFFPGGDPTPTEMDVTFPKRFRAGVKLMRFRIDDAQFHIRGGPLPTVESASLLLIGLGITMGYEQRIDYDRFQRCETPQAPEPPPLPPLPPPLVPEPPDPPLAPPESPTPEPP